MPKDLPDQKQQIAESAPSPEEAPQAISPVRSTASSPEWPLATKIIVGLVLVAISGFLIIRFNQYLNLLLMAFLLSFLVHPIARFVSKRLGIKWGASVLIVYLALAALIILLLARSGTTIYTQIEGLFRNLEANIGVITKFLDKYSDKEIVIGPLRFQTPALSSQFLSNQITRFFQPILGQAGTAAAKIVSWVGNALFSFGIVFMVSLFITSESEGVKSRGSFLRLQGYEADQKRMGREISNIFNSFVRGEFTIVGVATLIYSIWLGIMGVPYFLICAVIAGFGRFVPYVGAWIGWLSFIIASFLRTPPWGLSPLAYAAIILSVSLVVDTFLDHWLTPKIMGKALEVHPAAIMITALIGAQLFGLLGVILAAPFFASAKLFLTYIINKLTDNDPWDGISYYRPRRQPVYMKWLRPTLHEIGLRLKQVWQKTVIFLKKLFVKQKTK